MSVDAPAPSAPAQEAGADALVDEVLWSRLRLQGDLEAREVLIERHRPFAKMLAAVSYRRRIDDEIDFDDYHQWALVGMIEAVDRFDTSRGIHFETFASHAVRGCILDGIASATEKQRQLATRKRLRSERAAEAVDAASAPARVPRAGQAAELFRVLAEVGIGLALGTLLEGTGMMVGASTDAAPDRHYERMELRQLRDAVRSAVDELSEQEQHVVRGHYLQELRFSEIAERVGLTKGRVSQIHRQALEKLRGLLAAGGRLDVAL